MTAALVAAFVVSWSRLDWIFGLGGSISIPCVGYLVPCTEWLGVHVENTVMGCTVLLSTFSLGAWNTNEMSAV